MTPIETAHKAARAGISVVPPRQDGTKAPLGCWREYMQRRADGNELEAWYSDGRTGIGFVCGDISGGLEVIDFDDRGAWAEFKRLCKEAGLGELLSTVEAGYFEHSPNGAHLLYRCSETSGNTKLAKRGKKTLIETRGEGGYIVVAPTFGGVNPAGIYELVSGDVTTIVRLSPEQRQDLHNIARALDESLSPACPPPVPPLPLGDGRPGDDFNARATWEEVLSPHGWVPVFNRLGVTNWRRPGKKHGTSATTNHADSDLLYVFSTNTEFEAERGYSKFSAYALLSHGGDFEAASRHLRLLGYGSSAPVAPGAEDELEGVNFDAILAEGMPAAVEKRQRQTASELLRVPGVVGELARWFTESAIKPQPWLALGAAVSACSTILGQRVMTHTGLRTNSYVVGVAETGSGKENARQCIKRLFAEVGNAQMLGDSFASGSAVEQALVRSRVSLYLMDEVGHFFKALKSDAPAYVKEIVPVLLSLHGESSSVHTCRTFADSKKNEENVIYGPHLSLYCTAVPQNFYKNTTREQLSNGLLNRFLVFESKDPDPWEQWPAKETREPPKKVVDWCSGWLAFNGEGGDLRPEPVEISATSAAKDVFSALTMEARELKARAREAGESQGIYSRVVAHAMKLALIRAAGQDYEIDAGVLPEVTEEDALWGCDLAHMLVVDFAHRVLGGMTETASEEHCKVILDVIKEGGEHGVSKSVITRRTKHLKRKDRNDAVDTLIEAGEVAVAEVKRLNGPGRPGLRYFSRLDWAKNN